MSLPVGAPAIPTVEYGPEARGEKKDKVDLREAHALERDRHLRRMPPPPLLTRC
jgi:hypothetical protein